MRSSFWLVLGAVFCLSSCGRYGPPLPPESFAPAPVQKLAVLSTPEGLQFQWRSPQLDRRGEELGSLDRYLVYRSSDPSAFEDFLRDPQEYGTVIVELEDTSIVERDRLRQEAVANRLPSRRIGQPEELTIFSFVDSELTPGETYGYVVVPENQEGVEGEFRQFVRVLFRGEQSVVEIIQVTDLESLEPEIFS